MDGIPYSQDDFADYLKINIINVDSANSCPVVLERFNDWVNKICLDYEDSMLEEKYPEFKGRENANRRKIEIIKLAQSKYYYLDFEKLLKVLGIKDQLTFANYKGEILEIVKRKNNEYLTEYFENVINLFK